MSVNDVARQFDAKPWHSLTEVAKRLDIHVSTPWRWAKKGVHGQKLATVRVGGRRVVLTEDIKNFLERLNAPQPSASKEPSARLESTRIEAQLEEMGL
jgi:transposase